MGITIRGQAVLEAAADNRGLAKDTVHRRLGRLVSKRFIGRGD